MSDTSNSNPEDAAVPTNDEDGTTKSGGLGDDSTIPNHPDGVAAGFSRPTRTSTRRKTPSTSECPAAAVGCGREVRMADELRTTAAAYTVRPLDESTWDAFEELCSSSAGYPSGCWCNGMHAEGLTRDAAANRERKRTRVLAGTTHAALVFEGALCVGWCQYGPASEIVHIKNRRRYDQTQDGPLPDWRIGCTHARPGTGVRASRRRRWRVRSTSSLPRVADGSRATRSPPARCRPGSCSTGRCRRSSGPGSRATG